MSFIVVKAHLLHVSDFLISPQTTVAYSSFSMGRIPANALLLGSFIPVGAAVTSASSPYSFFGYST